MAGRGPQPTPTAILAARGSNRAIGRKGEPVIPAGSPAPPPWLKGDALAGWKALVPMLDGAGVLTAVDGPALAVLCTCYGNWLKADKLVRVEGMTQVDAKGVTRAHPMISASLGYAAEFRALCDRFGLSPAARTRIRTEAKPREVVPGQVDYFGSGGAKS